MHFKTAQTAIFKINYSQSGANLLLIKESQLCVVQTQAIIKTIWRRQSTNRFTSKY